MLSVSELALRLFLTCLPLSQALQFSSSLAPRPLQAASLVDEATRRDPGVFLRNNIGLHYVDSHAGSSQRPMAARVSLSSKYPSLMLEELEDLVIDIHCADDRVSISVIPARFFALCSTLDDYDEFLLITSHYGCNDKGSRLAYFVSAKTHNQASSTLELFVKPVAWKSAYSFKVEIHESNDEYIVNRHDHLKRSTIKVDRRDNDPSLTVSSISTLPSSARITFPSPNPKASPTATTIAQAVTTSYTDTKILPPDLLEGAVGGLSIGGIQIPDGVSVKCTNCTTYGSIRLVSGSFTSGSSTNDTRDNIILDAIDDVDDAVGFITDGYLQVAATGLGAHIELETIWSASVSHDFEITLATIPLQPWSIPNIAVIGPIFIPKLVIGVGVSADVNFKSGFSVSVPNNSTATVNIGNVTQSSLSGFDKTKFTSLPFTSDVENIALNVSLGLHPELLLGISFFGGIGEAGAGIFLDMPKLSLQVQPVSVAANERCELIADKGAANNALSLLKANLTHIVPVVDFAGGFVAEASMKVGGLPSIGKQTAWTPLATTFPGPTVCLAYDREQKDYVVASKAVAVAAAASSSIVAAATSSSAANRVSSPFSGAIIGLVGLQAVVICFWVVVGGLFVFEDQISSRLSI